MSRQEVKARLGDQECEVKTLDNTHLYCEPPEIQPTNVDDSNKLPSLKVTHHRLSIFRFPEEGSVHTHSPVFTTAKTLEGLKGFISE